jgi:hypothetical protein
VDAEEEDEEKASQAGLIIYLSHLHGCRGAGASSAVVDSSKPYSSATCTVLEADRYRHIGWGPEICWERRPRPAAFPIGFRLHWAVGCARNIVCIMT